jgi:hypothetical protein
MPSITRPGVSLLLVILSPFACASSGVVLYFPSSCDYFIVESDMGMAVMTATGASAPAEGDVLVGEFELRGPATLQNYVTSQRFEVQVEDYWLSEDAAIERYLEFCEPPPAM